MIPNVAGYSGFNSYGNTACAVLKPGQMTLDRKYYDKANQEKLNGHATLGSFRQTTNYLETNIKNIKPGDYKPKDRNANRMIGYDLKHNPDLFSYTKQGSAKKQRGGSMVTKRSPSNSLARTTNHWNTNYRNDTRNTPKNPS